MAYSLAMSKFSMTSLYRSSRSNILDRRSSAMGGRGSPLLGLMLLGAACAEWRKRGSREECDLVDGGLHLRKC